MTKFIYVGTNERKQQSLMYRDPKAQIFEPHKIRRTDPQKGNRKENPLTL